MVTDANAAGAACTSQCRPPRHAHPVPQLDAAGLTCCCGASAWIVRYGGPLPIALTCGRCLGAYQIERMFRRAVTGRGGE